MATQTSHDIDAGRIRVFSPHTRCVPLKEVSPEERKSVEAGEYGVWLDVECPENHCVTGEDKLTIPVRGAPPHQKEGLWHRLFCPEDRCYAEFPSDIPS